MKISVVLLASLTARLAAAHAFVFQVKINGAAQGRGTAIRKVYNNDPVKDVTSPLMTCNKNSGKAARSVGVKPGDKVVIEWAHNNEHDDIIASSHHGPVQVYIAPAASNGKGDVWVKVAADGFSNGQWAVDKLRKNRGEHSFVWPKISGGEYLIRPEILALHEGNRVGGAQFYMACIQVKSTGGGRTLPRGIAIPGPLYKANDKKSINYDIYSPSGKKGQGYTPPGGPIVRL